MTKYMKGKYAQVFRRSFTWKHEAMEFVRKLKKQNKNRPSNIRDRLSIKIEPLTEFISTAKWSESRTVSRVVVYSYLPHKKTR